MRYTGAATYRNRGPVGEWVYQSGPMSVLELTEEGGSLQPSLLGDLKFFKLFGLLPAPNIRFSWSEVERVEPMRGILPPWTIGLSFWLRGGNDFAFYTGLLPQRARKMLNLAESKGVPVSRRPTQAWTGRPKRRE